MMRLWNDEIDRYRAEARNLSQATPPIGGGRQFQPGDIAARVNATRKLLDAWADHSPASPIASDSTIPGLAGDVPVRFYVPDEPRGMYLHIHGGGWVAGSPRMTDSTNERIATRHRLAVMSVDYRLAPEHPYPAAPDDCESAACWMLEHGPTGWGVEGLLIGGESAGAHLAAVTMLRLRDRHGVLDRVLGANLVFGCYDMRGTPSTFNNGGKPDMLTPEIAAFNADCFLAGLTAAERRDPDVSPLFADLRGLPPCLVSVGTYDHLLDDSLFLAARLAAAESPVELAVYPDSPHGFTLLPTQMTQAHKARTDAWFAARLR